MPISSIPYNAKIIQGIGWAEGVEFHGLRNPFALKGSRGRVARPGVSGGSPACDRPISTQENKERAIRRAKTMIRRKAKELYGLAEGKLYMLTLTYQENMVDYDKALKDIRNFFHRLRRKIGRSAGYIAVPERQKRGAWHWHIIIDVHLDYKDWERLWGKGYIWVRKVRDVRHAARYVKKYITKAFEDEGVPKGKHRYLTSKGLCNWKEEYVTTIDECGTWLYFKGRNKEYKLIALMSSPEEGFIWWDALIEAMGESSLDEVDKFATKA